MQLSLLNIQRFLPACFCLTDDKISEELIQIRKAKVIKFTLLCFAIFLSLPGFSQWRQAAGMNGGTVNSMIIKDNVFMVATDGAGVFKSTDNGTNWTSASEGVLSNLEVGSFLTSGSGPSAVLFISSENGVWKSTDNGTTWTPSGLPNKQIFSLNLGGSAASPILFAATKDGVYKSINNGGSWDTASGTGANSLPNAPVMCLAIRGNTLFAGTSGKGLYKSINNGDSWTQVTIGGITNYNTIQILSIIYFNNNWYVGMWDKTEKGNVYKSGNDGETWTAVNNGFLQAGQPPYVMHEIRTFAISGGKLFVSTHRAGVYRLDETSNTWIPVNHGLTNIDVKSFYVAGGNLYAGTTGGGVFSFNDSNSTWTPVSMKGINNIEVRALAVRPGTNQVFAGTWGSGVYKSTDNGQTWSEFSTNLSNVDIESIAASNRVFVGASYMLPAFRKANVLGSAVDNAAWTAASLTTGGNNTPSKSVAVSGNTWFTGSDRGGIYRSMDNGDNWVKLGFPNYWLFDFRSLVISSTGDPNTTVVYAGYSKDGGGGVMRSINNGETWTDISERLPSSSVFSLVTSGNTLFAGTGRGVHKYDINTGWMAANLDTFKVNTLAVSGTNLFAGTKWGVYRSTNNGATWTEINAGLGNKNVNSLVVSGSNLVAGTNEKGVWLATIDNTAPVVTNLNPANNTINIPINSDLTITFNEPVQKGTGVITVNYGTVSKQINVTSAAVTINNNAVTINPPDDFPVSAIVHILIPTGAFTDLFGNPYAGITSNTIWNFKVVDDGVPPTIEISQNFKETDGSQAGTLTALVDDNVGVKDVRFRYRAITDGGDFTAPVPATLTTTAKTYQANIPANKLQDKLGIEYEFIATDAAGNETKKGDVIRRSYPNGLTIPYSRYGNTVDKYELIAIPLDLGSNNKVSNVFDELGNPDKKKWRIVEYTGNIQTPFRDLAASSTLDVKKGYWMIAKDNPGQALNTGAGKAVVAAPAPFKLELTATDGFQLIGNPYPFDITWGDIEKANPGIGERIRAFYVMENGEYKDIKGSATNSLKQLRGAVLDINKHEPNKPTELIFPVMINRTINPNGRIAQGRTPVQEGWVTYLTLTDGERQYDLSGFGMHQKAGADLDIHDRLVPPQLGEPFHLRFTTPTETGFAMTQDVVAPAVQHIWELVAEANTSKPYVEISWEYLPREGDGLWLYDAEGQQIVDMYKQTSYRYNGKGPKTFKIYFGKKEQITQVLGINNPMLMAIHPNPFREQTQIPFSIPEGSSGSNVEVAMYQLSGERVALLANGEFATGLHTITWNGKDGSGKPLPVGLYLCRFTVNIAGKTISYSRKVILY